MIDPEVIKLRQEVDTLLDSQRRLLLAIDALIEVAGGKEEAATVAIAQLNAAHNEFRRLRYMPARNTSLTLQLTSFATTMRKAIYGSKR